MPADTLFTWGSSNVTTLLATTESVRDKKIHDAIFKRIPTWFWLKKKSAVKYQGGASVIVPVMFAKNAGAKAYNGYDTLDVTPVEGISASQAKWAQYSVPVTVSGREVMQNQGEQALINLVDSKYTQAEMSLADKMAVHAMASTTQVADSGVPGLTAIPTIVDTTTAIQDIAKSGNSWWQAQVSASGSFQAQGTSDLKTLYNNILNQSVGDNGAPDFGVMTQTVFEAYEATLEPQKRFTDDDLAGAGFENLRYKNARFTFDTNCPSGTLFLLRSENLHLVIMTGRDFAATKFIQPTNQDAMVKQILFMGQIVTNNPRKLGKLTGVTA